MHNLYVMLRNQTPAKPTELNLTTNYVWLNFRKICIKWCAKQFILLLLCDYIMWNVFISNSCSMLSWTLYIVLFTKIKRTGQKMNTAQHRKCFCNCDDQNRFIQCSCVYRSLFSSVSTACLWCFHSLYMYRTVTDNYFLFVPMMELHKLGVNKGQQGFLSSSAHTAICLRKV